MANVNDVHDMAGQVENERRRLEEADIDEADREAIAAYATYREVSAGVAAGTLRDDMGVLRRTAERAEKPLLEFTSTKDTDRLLKTNRTDHGVSPSSNDNYRARMRSFFEWLNDDPDYPAFEWWEDVKIPTREVEPIDPDEIMGLDEVRALREAADHPRDKAIIEFLADTGMRVAAAMQLKRGGIDGLDSQHPTFKPNKDGEAQKGIDTLPLPIIQSQRWLRVWLNQYHPLDAPDAPVFTTRDYLQRIRVEDDDGEVIQRDVEKGALHPSTVHTEIKYRAEAIGIDPSKVNIHSFRHVAVTRMRRDMGMDWDDIAHRTGWSDASIARMKQTYSHLTHEDKNRRVWGSVGRDTDDDGEDTGPVFIDCVNCGREMNADNRYCPDCGLDQEADMVGGQLAQAFSRLDRDQAERLMDMVEELGVAEN